MEDARSLAEMFLRQTPACQWIVDRTGAFERFYGDPLSLFGHSESELLGKLPDDVLDDVIAVAWSGRFTRALQGETMQLRERRASGNWYVTVFPIRSDGEIRHAGGLAREITPWAAA